MRDAWRRFQLQYQFFFGTNPSRKGYEPQYLSAETARDNFDKDAVTLVVAAGGQAENTPETGKRRRMMTACASTPK